MARIKYGRRGEEVKAYALDGDGLKDIPFSAVSSHDIGRWFYDNDKANAPKDPMQLYGRVWVLFRCVEIRAQMLASMPRQIVEMESGRVIAAANFSTPQVDEQERPLLESSLPFKVKLNRLLWQFEAAQCLMAASYAHILRNRVKVTELRWLDPRTITPEYDSQVGVKGFERKVNGKPSTIPVENMCWAWRPGLAELGPGVAPGQVVAEEAGIARYMNQFLTTFFEKGAMPTTVVFAESKPPEQERGRIKAYLERILSGIGNAFGIEVLAASLKFQTLTPPIKDMVIPQVREDAHTGIAGGLGVPLSLVFSDAANYATAQTDDLHFYTKTLLPEAGFMAEYMNETFWNKLGLSLVFRPDQLEIFQQLETKKVTDSLQLYDRGAIDEDELRAAAGYEPRPQKAKAPEPPPAPEPVEEQADDDTAEQDELKAWERKVLKRLGKAAPYTIPFEPAHLKTERVLAVRKALLSATTAEEVKAAFAAPFCVPATKTNTRQDNDELGRLEGDAAQEIAQAFAQQLTAVRHIKGATSLNEIMVEVRLALTTSAEPLLTALTKLLTGGSSAGIGAAKQFISQQAAVGFDWELADANASEWVKTYGFDLITGINETSATRMQKALEQWVNEVGTLDDLVESIRPIFANDAATERIERIFGVDRAQMIAETEATRAYAEGKITAYMASDLATEPPVVKPPDDSHPRCRCDIDLERRAGVWHWVWFTANDEFVCDICGPSHLQSVGVATPVKGS